MAPFTRRQFVSFVGVGAMTLAGCSSDTDESVEAATDTTTSVQTSTLQGTTDENNQTVDLQYRDYNDREVDAIRDSAQSLSYDDLFRNIESYTGEAVTFEAEIIQFLESEDYNAVLYQFDSSLDDIAYGSWVGDRYLRGDVVTVWAEVLGTETYESGAGSQLTVPALSVAAMDLESTEEE